MDILFAPFMLRALLAAAVTGLAAPAVGTSWCSASCR